MYSPLPQGVISGNFIITSSESLTQETHSRRLHNFVHIGLDAQDVSITKSELLPPSLFFAHLYILLGDESLQLGKRQN